MKTKNLVVGALAAVLTLALWWNFLLKPTQTTAKAVKADTAAARTKLQPLEAQLARAQADAAHSTGFKAQLAVLQRAVPVSPALADFIRDANAIADASKISWQSVTHGPPLPGEAGVASITVGIQIKGTYEQVMDYLGRIAALKRLLVLDGVQFSSSGTTGAGPGGATSGAAASTGPFSGASEVMVTITARMFERPPALAAATAGSDSSGGTPTTQPSSLNNT